jgi:hypothetical protein
VSAALGAGWNAHRCVVTLPGDAYRMEAACFEGAVAGSAAMAAVLGRYVHAMLMLAGQAAVCHAAHTVEQQCARWLLTLHDRYRGAGAFPLTHDDLAVRLRVRRASVTVVLGTFRRAGLVTYGRGIMRVVDRARLEGAACECYALRRVALESVRGAPYPGHASPVVPPPGGPASEAVSASLVQRPSEQAQAAAMRATASALRTEAREIVRQARALLPYRDAPTSRPPDDER